MYFCKLFLTFLFCTCAGNVLTAQFQKPQAPAQIIPSDKESIRQSKLQRKNQSALPAAAPTIFDDSPFTFQGARAFHKPLITAENVVVKTDPSQGFPIFIKATFEELSTATGKSVELLAKDYLRKLQELLPLKDAAEEFVVYRQSFDDEGRQHLRMKQMYQGLEVYGAEVILHTDEVGQFYLFNGRYYPTPQLESTQATMLAQAAKEVVINHLGKEVPFKELSEFEQKLIGEEPLRAKLLIYHIEEMPDRERLVWHITARPNVVSRWEYFVDAHSGEVLHRYNNICQIHGGRCAAHPFGKSPDDIARLEPTPKNGFRFCENTNNNITTNTPPGPETAVAMDLLGINRTIHVYQTGGTYFMIDASRDMFNSVLSNFPNEPAGTIWTISGNNNSPQNNNFEASHITSSNNNWNNANSVSAHYNGGKAYEYFLETFNRNSINGQGGNIVSLINITEANGQPMDNAFWNGSAIFYGSGDQAFEAPLAKGLDVAGHEMSHGVIQSTANLQYQNESGAMNESFADIFGAMIDREDWQIGEDVVSSIYPSGAMRNMQDPHNGGNSSNFYWQPAHYSERYTGTQDNGGVHINSGILNRAYYLFASHASVGKDIAEQIYYKALKDFLVASAKFVDLRNAVLEVAQSNYGSTVTNAAADAFQQVGIGAGSGSSTPDDADTNPGQDFILWSDNNLSNIFNATTEGADAGVFSNNDHLSKPSVSDDGSLIDYVAADNNLWEINVDWATGNIVDEYTLSTTGNWRNVAISKDGQRLAAVTTDYDNLIWVYDFGLQQWQSFELYNPTFTQGVTTGDVDYADVLEFDFSGEYLMYDAQSTISSDFGQDISYWDIGFLRVWNHQTNNFSSGDVQKLFSGLPENVSVGNPTFSKNSPYIIAFDYIEQTGAGTNYAVLGINLETYDQGLIWQNNQLGYPSYSMQDDVVIFSVTNNGLPIIGRRSISNDKITGVGDAQVLIENARWATWFATGERQLVGTSTLNPAERVLRLSPNPFQENLQVEYLSEGAEVAEIALYDMMGRNLYTTFWSLQAGMNRCALSVGDLSAGAYLVVLKMKKGMVSERVMRGTR